MTMNNQTHWMHTKLLYCTSYSSSTVVLCLEDGAHIALAADLFPSMPDPGTPVSYVRMYVRMPGYGQSAQIERVVVGEREVWRWNSGEEGAG